MPKKKKTLLSEWSRKKPLYLEKNDKRYARHTKQLKEWGFSDSETWALDSVICQFVLPRLKRFKEIHGGYPMGMTDDKWVEILDKMIFALDWSLTCDEKCATLSQHEQKAMWKRYEKGINLFAEYFRHLWW